MNGFSQFFFDIERDFSKTFGSVWDQIWWIVLLVIAVMLFWHWWEEYLTFKFLSSINWKLLEIKVPKNVLQTPRSMEQIFAAAHAPYSYGLKFLERHWEGKREWPMVFEMVGIGGDIHFYLRVPAQHQNLMESAIYSQYPEAEITEIPASQDYVKQMPAVLPNKIFDLFGIEFYLQKPNPYPIRTYIMFEDPIEERRVDSIGILTELMSKLKNDEQIWIQIIIRPIDDSWTKEGKEIIDKIMGRDKKKEAGPPLFGVSMQEAILSPIEHPSLEVEKKKNDKDFKFVILSPSEKEAAEGIEKKMAKLGFETMIRFLYIDRRDSFSRDNVMGIMGAFRQYSTQNLNLLRPNKKTMTGAVHGMFKKLRLNLRRRIIYERYTWKSLGAKKAILNIEELATIYHFPITNITSPQLNRTEAKKGSPPSTLPLVD